MGWRNLAGRNIFGGNTLDFFSGRNQENAAEAAAQRLEAGKKEAYGFLDPYAKAGQTALNPLQALLTGTGPNGEQLSEAQRSQSFYQSPGYKFALDQALKGVEASQASKGNLLSGGAQKEIAQFSSGLASQNYNDYLSQLFKFAGIGENAALGKANVATGVGSQLAQADFSAGTASDVGMSRLLNLASGIGGLLAGSGGGASTSGAGSNLFSSSGGGTVNMSPFIQAQSNV